MLQMRILCVLLCVSIVWADEEGRTFEGEGGAGRGPRVSEHAQTSCKYEKSWPICSDDQWGQKCPSGCRMQGLVDDTSNDFNHRLDKIRKLLDVNENKYKKSKTITTQTINSMKGTIADDHNSDSKYGQVSEELRRRIVLLKNKVLTQIERINALQNSIREQVVEMKRMEVDIDIKIRACKGSCAKSFDYHVDKESYDNIQKQLAQASSIKLHPDLSFSNIKVLKMKPMKDSTVPPHFKTGHHLEGPDLNFLNEMQQVELVLETPETGKKLFPGDTSYSSSVHRGDGETQGSKLVHSSYGSETSFGDGVSSSSTHYTCTRTVTRKVVTGPDGPKEEVVEKYTSSDGSDCSHLRGLGKEDIRGGFNVRVTTGGEGDGFSNLDKVFSFTPDSESVGSRHSSSSSSVTSFAHTSTGTGSRHVSGGSSHSLGFEGSDVIAELGEGEEDVFTGSEFPSKVSSAVSSKTVVSSSTSFNKGGSTFETKSLKTVPGELDGFLHDESAEDDPDFKARSFKTDTFFPGPRTAGTDCEDIRQKHTSDAKSGIFRIKPAGSNKVLSVYCDQETTLGGWLLIQQRIDGSVNFNQTWQDYKKGFGSVDAKGKGELWLGNENIHLLTQKDTVLRVELEDWAGNTVYAEYNIHVGSESQAYVLSVSNYEGTAGDALITGSVDEGSEYTSHANMKFSTFDRDSDQWEENCAEVHGGGWWYNNCQAANLNGMYYLGGQYDPRNNVPYEVENGVVWIPFRASDYSLKTVRMKIRPKETL
ncbi:PREDICTED: fibrinogen alpha chain [Gavialis gangeticus]|uniref:fibrinogen alpha chain n=1 Tax=Gavialis gangeticus TaxID=94835 RepID=UPI00092EBFE8|nr:PREDICTED: fibrinogen alpha chain [Gavialis gangeticus]